MSYEGREGIVMRGKILQLLLVLAAVGVAAPAALSHSQRSLAQDASGQRTERGSQFRSSAVRILEPRAGQVLTNNFVTVRFELVRPNPAGGNNNFVIRLDSHDPIDTSEMEYTFTEMRPGQHMISVTEVDANGSPLPDARAEVEFSVKPPEGTTPSPQIGSKNTTGK
jgi:hypothetical protein